METTSNELTFESAWETRQAAAKAGAAHAGPQAPADGGQQADPFQEKAIVSDLQWYARQLLHGLKDSESGAAKPGSEKFAELTAELLKKGRIRVIVDSPRATSGRELWSGRVVWNEKDNATEIYVKPGPLHVPLEARKLNARFLMEVEMSNGVILLPKRVELDRDFLSGKILEKYPGALDDIDRQLVQQLTQTDKFKDVESKEAIEREVREEFADRDHEAREHALQEGREPPEKSSEEDIQKELDSRFPSERVTAVVKVVREIEETEFRSLDNVRLMHQQMADNKLTVSGGPRFAEQRRFTTAYSFREAQIGTGHLLLYAEETLKMADADQRIRFLSQPSARQAPAGYSITGDEAERFQEGRRASLQESSPPRQRSPRGSRSDDVGENQGLSKARSRSRSRSR
jgi:hypothetical protein